ncbi:hypothetical protein BJ963_001191 [Leifsonia soli]|uniref:Uncharacterized protein n=1 Tax=Leifsonia soli TaxID=582665 RepID=A0A852SYD5_9MICO|nr:hypothetical protein [Leifsonia soli]
MTSLRAVAGAPTVLGRPSRPSDPAQRAIAQN